MKYYYVEDKELHKATDKALEILNNCPVVERENQDHLDKMKECGMTIHVEDVNNPMISEAFPGYYHQLVEYKLELVDGIKDFEMAYKRDDNGGWSYTYHEIIADNIENCINELKRNKITRRAVLPVAGDKSYSSIHPPCLQNVYFQVSPKEKIDESGNKKIIDSLDTVVNFRSNDAFRAFVMNSFGLIELARYISLKVGIEELGSYTHHASNFHVYSTSFEDLNNYCLKSPEKRRYLTYEKYLSRYDKDAEEVINNCKNRESQLQDIKYNKILTKTLKK